MVSGLVLLNLAGGEGLDDLDRLEAGTAVCAGWCGRRTRAHSAGAVGRGAALAAAAVAHAALAACDGPVAYGVHDAGEEARREAGRARGRGGPVTGEPRSSAGGSGAASGGAGD